MKKQKLIEYSKDNLLGWSEEDFRDVICSMVNIKILTGEPLHPVLNKYYLNYGDKWHSERCDKILGKKVNKTDIKLNKYFFL